MASNFFKIKKGMTLQPSVLPVTGELGDLTFDISSGSFKQWNGAAWVALGGGGASLTVQDEGSNLSIAVTKIDFAGTGVTATMPVAGEILVTIPTPASDATKLNLTGGTLTGNLLLNNSNVMPVLDVSGGGTGKLGGAQSDPQGVDLRWKSVAAGTGYFSNLIGVANMSITNYLDVGSYLRLDGDIAATPVGVGNTIGMKVSSNRDFVLWTSTEPANETRFISLQTGNSGVANSGRILLQTGTAAGTRGKVEINSPLKITDGTEGAGKVLTSNVSGDSTWQVPASDATKADLQLSNVSGTTAVPVDLLPSTNNSKLLGSGTFVWSGIWGNQVSALNSIGLRDTANSPLFNALIQTVSGKTGGFFRDSTIQTGADGFGFAGRLNNHATNRTSDFMVGTGSNNAGGGSGNLVFDTGSTPADVNKGRIKLNSIIKLPTVSNASPQDGDIWFDGTDLKIRTGGVTKTFTIV